MRIRQPFCIVLWRVLLLPYYVSHKVLSSEHLVTDDLEVVAFVVVDADPYTPVLAEEPAEQLQARVHEAEPCAVLEVVVVVLKGVLGVVRRVYVDALHLPGVVGQQGLERFEVVAVDEHVGRGGVPPGERGVVFQQAVWHLRGLFYGLFFTQPGESRHIGFLPCVCEFDTLKKRRRQVVVNVKSPQTKRGAEAPPVYIHFRNAALRQCFRSMISFSLRESRNYLSSSIFFTDDQLPVERR